MDDLEEIGDLEGYITRASSVLVYCSKGYFQSKNCMRELISATKMGKPIIALTEPDVSKGGLSSAQVRQQLRDAEDMLYAKWGFNEGKTPTADELYDHLFEHETIEWNRFGHFQDVTMRLIAERLLPEPARVTSPRFALVGGGSEITDAGGGGWTYVDRELLGQSLQPLPPPKDGCMFHVFCSDHNPGAAALMADVAKERGMTVHVSGSGNARNPLVSAFSSFSMKAQMFFAKARKSKKKATAVPLLCTSTLHRMELCEHYLLYLTSETWTRGEASAELAAEVKAAMDAGLHILLAHEMPGDDGQARNACDFGAFFVCSDGATPGSLIKRGLYSEIAVPLKGGHFRKTSMVLLSLALGMSKEEAADASKGDQGLFGDGFDLRRLASLSSILPEVSLRRRSVLRDLSDLSTRMRRRSTRPRSSSTAPADADPEMAPSDADGQPVETTPVREIS